MNDEYEICGRLSAVPMPINAEGKGPEMDPSKVVRTDWEIWDESIFCVAIVCGQGSDSENVAKKRAIAIVNGYNKQFS